MTNELEKLVKRMYLAYYTLDGCPVLTKTEFHLLAMNDEAVFVPKTKNKSLFALAGAMRSAFEKVAPGIFNEKGVVLKQSDLTPYIFLSDLRKALRVLLATQKDLPPAQLARNSVYREISKLIWEIACVILFKSEEIMPKLGDDIYKELVRVTTTMKAYPSITVWLSEHDVDVTALFNQDPAMFIANVIDVNPRLLSYLDMALIPQEFRSIPVRYAPEIIRHHVSPIFDVYVDNQYFQIDCDGDISIFLKKMHMCHVETGTMRESEFASLIYEWIWENFDSDVYPMEEFAEWIRTNVQKEYWRLYGRALASLIPEREDRETPTFEDMIEALHKYPDIVSREDILEILVCSDGGTFMSEAIGGFVCEDPELESDYLSTIAYIIETYNNYVAKYDPAYRLVKFGSSPAPIGSEVFRTETRYLSLARLCCSFLSMEPTLRYVIERYSELVNNIVMSYRVRFEDNDNLRKVLEVVESTEAYPNIIDIRINSDVVKELIAVGKIVATPTEGAITIGEIAYKNALYADIDHIDSLHSDSDYVAMLLKMTAGDLRARTALATIGCVDEEHLMDGSLILPRLLDLYIKRIGYEGLERRRFINFSVVICDAYLDHEIDDPEFYRHYLYYVLKNPMFERRGLEYLRYENANKCDMAKFDRLFAPIYEDLKESNYKGLTCAQYIVFLMFLASIAPTKEMAAGFIAEGVSFTKRGVNYCPHSMMIRRDYAMKTLGKNGIDILIALYDRWDDYRDDI